MICKVVHEIHGVTFWQHNILRTARHCPSGTSRQRRLFGGFGRRCNGNRLGYATCGSLRHLLPTFTFPAAARGSSREGEGTGGQNLTTRIWFERRSRHKKRQVVRAGSAIGVSDEIEVAEAHADDKAEPLHFSRVSRHRTLLRDPCQQLRNLLCRHVDNLRHVLGLVAPCSPEPRVLHTNNCDSAKLNVDECQMIIPAG